MTFGSSPRNSTADEIEDEHVLFCEHAQLYSPTNEPETGEIKILQNRTNHSSRIVFLHRDAISNIRIDHPITSDTDLQADASRDNAYV